VVARNPRGFRIAACESCPADVFWCKSDRGKMLLVDLQPDPKGSLLIEKSGHRTPLAHVIPAGERDQHEGALHMAHFVTCPNAAAHRRQGGRA
jgi:hypothetical protein